MRYLSVLVCCALMQPYVLCQDAGLPRSGPLNVEVVKGDGTVNNVRTRVPTEAAVRLTDEAGKPVGGGAVSFILPTQGASGSFSNRSQSITIPTDANGVASARVKPNGVVGRLEVRVNAAYAGNTARAVITQHNMSVPGAGGGAGKAIAILAIVGGAAAGGAVAYMRTQRETASPAPPAPRPPPIVITPGAGSAGPPL